MSLLTELVSQTIIDELYKAGYSILPPRLDPFYFPESLIPGGWVYQWNVVDDFTVDWEQVYCEDHPGWFAPPGSLGRVVRHGMVLCKKRKDQVDNTPAHSRKRSQQQLEAWADRFGAFTGGATMLQTNGEEVQRTTVTAGKGVETKVETYERPATKTVELISKIPKDMLQYIDQIFAERDRIRDETVLPDRSLLPGSAISDAFYAAIERDKGAPWYPTLNAIILPYAIENVRKAIFQPNKDEAESTS